MHLNLLDSGFEQKYKSIKIVKRALSDDKVELKAKSDIIGPYNDAIHKVSVTRSNSTDLKNDDDNIESLFMNEIEPKKRKIHIDYANILASRKRLTLKCDPTEQQLDQISGTHTSESVRLPKPRTSLL